MFKGKYSFAITMGIVLTLFTLYVLLDVFIIPHAYSPVIKETKNTPAPTDVITMPTPTLTPNSSQGLTPSSDTYLSSPTPTERVEFIDSDTQYQDENINITLTEYNEYDSDIYVADVVLKSAQYLKAAFAKDTYGKNVRDKTSVIAETAGALLAVNGDYYGARDYGYVIRNGTLYRETKAADREDLVIWANGDFEVVNENDISANELYERGALHVFSFGPGLLSADGKAMTTFNSQVKPKNPRTAVGQIDTLHYVFVVCDGRGSQSEGLKLSELSEFMEKLGCKVAYNLDGGGSSAMYFHGQLVNRPSTFGEEEERKVSDILYIGY